MTGVFVTGTDTGIGKTWVSAALLRALCRAGVRAVGMKPVQTGVAAGATDDATLLRASGNVDAPPHLVNPYGFAPAIAPHVAAREAGVAMELGRIGAAFGELAKLADIVVVEGAGGPLVPIDDRHDMLDIAAGLRVPVVLVVGVRLGCISHARLCALAIRARGLVLAGWVPNCIDPAMSRSDASITAIERSLAAPRIATFAWRQTDWPGEARLRDWLR